MNTTHYPPQQMKVTAKQQRSRKRQDSKAIPTLPFLTRAARIESSAIFY